MSNLFAARAQMGSSLAFHIIFAALGMGLPVLLVIAEGLWLKTGNPIYLALARRWSKAFAVIFAVGAVSGTILSFELGLLWPEFMKFAGGIIGMPFSAEGFAFFIEAIFLGLYLYGWNRLSPKVHWLCGLPIAISGALSAVFVISANAWMNSPSGFRVVDGKVVDVDPLKAMFNAAWFQQALHMTLAAYVATGFAVAGLYAIGMLRGHRDAYHRAGLTIAIGLGALVIPFQIVSGDLSARWVAENQPVKFAALEGQFQTEHGAALILGGYPDPNTRETKYALEIPNLLSLIAYQDPHATIKGLDEWPLADQPDPRPVHFAFDLMVGLGFAMLAIGAWYWLRAWKSRKTGEHWRPPVSKWLLRALAVATPFGFLAIECGWTVTEVGRQPWIIYGYMRTADAVTEVPGQFASFGGFTLVYIILAVTSAWLVHRLAMAPLRIEEVINEPAE
jgi:cytochrome bd ubiquinol oxidase subunit I